MPQNPSELVFTLNRKYKLKNDGSTIKLDVITGTIGQSPDITVKLNSKKILEHANKSIKDLIIDVDNNLENKILKIIGNITDTSNDSDKIEVTLKVKGGVDDLSKKFTVTVEDEGEEVDIAFIIRF
ncbi:MAG TPA: hypothetical protein VK498_04280 [Ferruginibacter sp.]|nr:hypothetical protein [Ferruginibacter sp.]